MATPWYAPSGTINGARVNETAKSRPAEPRNSSRPDVKRTRTGNPTTRAALAALATVAWPKLATIRAAETSARAFSDWRATGRTRRDNQAAADKALATANPASDLDTPKTRRTKRRRNELSTAVAKINNLQRPCPANTPARDRCPLKAAPAAATTTDNQA